MTVRVQGTPDRRVNETDTFGDGGGSGGSGGLTNAELRASPVPVDVSDTSFASTTADGADVTQGAIADVAVDTDTTGTVSGKLRGLVKLMVNLLSRWPAVLGAGGGLKVDGSGTALPVTVASVAGDHTVVGKAADGAAVSGNPVLTAGFDGANVQTIFTDGSGRPNALIVGTAVGTGTATTIKSDTNGGVTAAASSLTNADGRNNAQAAPIDGGGSVMFAPMYPHIFNGTTWDRQRGDATDGTLVNLGSNNDVTVASGAITETNSAAIAASLATLDNIVSGSEAQVDIVAALPAGTNNIGDVDVLSLPSIPAGTNNIGDVDVLTLPALVAGTANVGIVRTISTSGRVVDSDDGTTVIAVKYANGIATASGDNVVLALVTGKKIRVLGFTLQVHEDTAGTPVIAQFQDASTATGRGQSWKLTATADGGSQQGVVIVPSELGQFETAAGVGLDVNLSAAIDVAWSIVYVEVD